MKYAVWTKEDVLKALGSDNFAGICQELDRTKNAVRKVRSDYTDWIKNGNESTYLQEIFNQIGKEIKVVRFIRQKQAKNAMLRKLTLDEIKKVIYADHTGDIKKVAGETGRSFRRIAYLIQFYNSWMKTGKVYIHHEKIAELFYQANKELGLPLPKDYKPAKSYPEETPQVKKLYSPMPSDKRDPFTELDILFDNFKEHIINLIPELVKNLLSEEWQKGYVQGKEEMRKEIEKNYKEKTLGELLKSKLGLLKGK